MSKVNVEELVGAYVNIRAARDELKQGYEVKDEALKSEMGQIEAMLLTVCNDVGADSIKTQHGTAIRSLKERYYSTDWDSFRQFELEHPEWDFRERRVHQANMKSFMAENADDGLPPGLNTMREYTISVRKSSK